MMRRSVWQLAVLATLHAACLSFSWQVQGAEVEWQIRQLADVRLTHQNLYGTDLVPVIDWLGVRSDDAAYLHRFNLSASTVDVRITGQARLQLSSASEDKPKAYLDTISAELTLDSTSFVFAGRRHFVQGTSYGINPADVFFDPLTQDRSLNETRRRQETLGVDAVGVEVLASNRLTLSGFVAPAGNGLNAGQSTRAGISAALLAPDSNMDLSALAFWDARPGLAVSLSTTRGEAWVVYADTALRRNRSLVAPRPLDGVDAGAFISNDINDGRWYFAGTVGAGLTLASGASFNLEYSRKSDGYSAGEWSEMVRLIGASAQEWRVGPVPERGQGRLLTLNGMLRAETLRRNYLFGRAAFPQVAFFGEASLELSMLHGLDDRSGVLSIRVEKVLQSGTTWGIYSSQPYGGHRSEFGLRGMGLKVVAYVTHSF
ncbi:hypothetical protein [Verminephrobacter aporrectodeae]|uniref:hypothetical protein n=1 Tax=Verminephrobacter aporrectodeae TaxID=1110389 RepID=UPI0003062B00|nr:hypothetical protein [Verminephrobacter aporrectodeae]